MQGPAVSPEATEPEVVTPNVKEKEILITEDEAMKLIKVPFEHKVRELGAIRANKHIGSRTLRASKMQSFREGYEFCMAMHAFQPLEETQAPPPSDEKVSEGGIILP